MMLRQSARLQRQFAHGAIVQTPRTRTATTTGKLHPSCAIMSKRAAVVGLLSGLFVAGGASVPGSRSVAMAASASEIEKALQDPQWPDKWPFPADAFKRYDEQVDTAFYSAPRLVYHIDEKAVGALTKHYSQVFPASGNKDVAILDICSSWVSHYPEGYKAGRVAGLGMNADELSRNPQLTEHAVQDLNADPRLPYEDNSFDVITNCVSVDYLTRPLEVFKEMHRCLKPGGKAIMSFSNRCFPTKAITIWTQTGDVDHVWIVGAYFHYGVPGGFSDPIAQDISPGKGSDPMYVVYASKKA